MSCCCFYHQPKIPKPG
ncbi:cyclic lactone autoinducer peptide [Alishewanella sp. 16-MA]|uniref:Cyclic lactone autoinducer peptide n=1 Tax=Alishewanella maricola TaxID=2795740 RepID=A0ABS8BZ88_9ALTE|nr:cyclic lactone autoinducer peptide [Alishewanella maricola]